MAACLQWQSHPAKVVGATDGIFVVNFRAVSQIADLLMCMKNPATNYTVNSRLKR